MKKLFALLLALCILFTCASALAAPMVVDQIDLFSSDEEAQMERVIERIRDNYQMDAVVVTTRLPSMSDSALTDWADRYYEDHGYGLGEDRAGMLIMIDMGNRYVHISTAGVLIDYLNDSRKDDLLDAAQNALSIGRYGQGALNMLRQMETYLRTGREDHTFRYDEATGARLSGMYNSLTRTEGLVACLAGTAAAAALVFSVIGSYSLKGGAYHYDRAANTACKFTDEKEQFLRQHVSRMRTPPPSSSGGSHGGGSGGSGVSVHTSSGGMSHGGGGRHF